MYNCLVKYNQYTTSSQLGTMDTCIVSRHVDNVWSHTRKGECLDNDHGLVFNSQVDVGISVFFLLQSLVHGIH